MGIKITDIIGEFPTNDEYQIVDVTQISQKGIKISLRVVFQRLDDSEHVKEIKFIDVSYTRLIVIGTIWKNEKKVRLPSFFESYQVFNFNFSELEPSNEQFEFEEFGNAYIKEIQKSRRESSYNLITYNVPLSLARKEDGITKLFKPNPEWKNQKIIEFVSFFPHEFLRFFLTSNEISDLNGIFYEYNNTNGKWNDKNKVFILDESIEENGEFNVSLKYNKYQNDTNLIGDAIYLDSFRTTLFDIQNLLNIHNYYYLSKIKKAPVDNCKRFTFSGLTITRKSDGAKGLLVFLIEECTNYRPNEYTCLLTNIENNEVGSGDKKNTLKVRYNGGSPNIEKATPVVIRNSTRSHQEHEIDESGLEFLLNPKQPSKVKLKNIKSQSDGKFIAAEARKNEIATPNINGESGGQKPKLPEYFEQTIYFEFYKEIIVSLKNTMEKDNFAVTIRHCNIDKQWSTDLQFIDKELFYLPIRRTKIDNCKIYITHIKVIDSKQQIKFFTLFEQNNGAMTLMYARNGFKGISDLSIPENIENCLKYFPRKNYPKGTKKEHKDLLDGALVHYFNHKQTKEKGSIDIEATERPIRETITQKEAINNHVTKIKNVIIKAFK